ncbi:MAG: AMP-binding protein, partial [Pseudohongiellaceae bacterium]
MNTAPPPVTVPELLAFNASERPELCLLAFESGERFTSVQVLEAARQRAAGLQALGVKQDDKVLCWLPNGPDAVLLWLGVNLLGAVFVPINTAYKGRLLQHVIHSSGAALLVADGRLLDCLLDIDTGPLCAMVVVGPQRLAQTTLVQHDQQLLLGATAALQPPPRPLQPWDTECVIFTSGTTGPSKGVLCSYRHTHRAALEFRHVGPGDTNLVALPLFHIGGILGVNFALIHGGTAAIGDAWLVDNLDRVYF